jgi:hypothetical protein
MRSTKQVKDIMHYSHKKTQLMGGSATETPFSGSGGTIFRQCRNE